MKITIDFSKLPSDVALFLAQSFDEHLDAIGDSLSVALALGEPERQMIRDELIGVLAAHIDPYLT